MTLVTICIPTYNRPNLVREAVESALAQTYSPIEIIIADDSTNLETQHALSDIIDSDIVYVRNVPSLGQSENVHRLFTLARGELLMLLHDDDLLLPDAVAELAKCFSAIPDLSVAYGKQYLIGRDGICDEAASHLLNVAFYRTTNRAGLQPSAMHASLTRQFPNDGFMIRSSVAKTIGYRCDLTKVGVACDLSFGLRLAAAVGGFYFLDRYTAIYRISDESVSAGNKDAHLIYDLIASVELAHGLEGERQAQMRRFSRSAVNAWLASGNKEAALRVFLSPAHGWRQRASFIGLLHAALLVSPASLSQWFVKFIRSLRGG